MKFELEIECEYSNKTQYFNVPGAPMNGNGLIVDEHTVLYFDRIVLNEKSIVFSATIPNCDYNEDKAKKIVKKSRATLNKLGFKPKSTRVVLGKRNTLEEYYIKAKKRI